MAAMLSLARAGARTARADSTPWNILEEFFDDTRWRPLWSAAPGRAGLRMPLDVYVQGDEYVVEVELPGIQPGDVEVQATGQTLTIRAVTRAAARGDAASGARGSAEHRYEASVTLPPSAAAGRAAATFKDGLVRVVAPMHPTARPRRIPIRVASRDTSPRTSFMDRIRRALKRGR